MLRFIHRVERTIGSWLRPATVRCRVRARAIVIELDQASLDSLSGALQAELEAAIGALPGRPPELPVLFERYRNGSAFLTGAAPPLPPA
jgi:uncharacterized protein